MQRHRLASLIAVVLACGSIPAVASAAEPTESAAAIVPEPEAPEPPEPALDDPFPPETTAAVPEAHQPRHEAMWPPCTGVEFPPSEDERRAAAESEILDAERAFRNGESEIALAHLDFAECLHADPDYDFMRAVIHATNRNCADARAAADAYFASGPNQADANALRDRMGTCAPPVRSLSEPLAPTPDPLPPPERKRPDTDTDAPRAWHRDPVGGALLGVGLVSTVIGTGLVIGGQRVSAEDSSNYADFEQRRTRSRNLKIAGGTMLGVGLGLTVAAVVRYVIVSRRTSGSRATARKAARRTVAAKLLRPVVRF
jgi:hypothetical protein